MKSIFENLELIFKRFATKLGDSRADETDSLVGFIMCINSLLLLSRVCSIYFYFHLLINSGSARACARAQSLMGKENGNLSMREILVKASGMARGRVRRTSPQMTFLHEVIFAQRDPAC